MKTNLKKIFLGLGGLTTLVPLSIACSSNENKNTDNINDQNQNNKSSTVDSNNNTNVDKTTATNTTTKELEQYNERQVTFESLIPKQSLAFKENISLKVLTSQAIDYLEINEFINMIDGLVDKTKYVATKDQEGSEWTFKPYNEETKDGVKPYLKFNYKDNTIEYNSEWVFNAFKETTDSQDSTYSKHFKNLEDEIIKQGNPVIKLNLSNYGMKLHYDNDKLYIPFDVLNLLFGSKNRILFYITGTKIFASTPFLPVYTPESQKLLQETRRSGETKKDREYNLNFFSFVMDNFYGFKNKVKGGFKNLTTINKDKLLSLAPNQYLEEYINIFSNVLNDPHSQFVDFSYYVTQNTPELNRTSAEGTKINDINTNMQKLRGILLKNHPQQGDSPTLDQLDSFSVPYALTHGDLAIIKINDFVIGDEKPQQIPQTSYTRIVDTFARLKYIIDNTIKKNKEIKKIVLDLSTNRGGEIVQAEKIIGLMTDEDIKHKKENSQTGKQYIQKIKVDANIDGNFDDQDAENSYKWYVMTSPVTFSAANYLAQYAKDYKLATLIGQKSSGGTYSIMPFVLPDGTTLTISSPDGSVDKNGLSIEDGVTPDIEIPYDDFYNETKIQEILSKDTEKNSN
ncbi:S41 family peptidase [Mycoplasma sp. CSL7503-lung]|uniref:S41 family peptidase n=1 Tax=Mycoplasma sp. CSL7503-lung TaxID=536372 RepID=UPI0021D0ECE9|nr:S41 family peptidase [Mycoplasma sp. CSL7503-lung]MCU4706672.1 S41 family peptidase [Mycoplasma sp. CSL7503-lung]